MSYCTICEKIDKETKIVYYADDEKKGVSICKDCLQHEAPYLNWDELQKSKEKTSGLKR